MALDSSSKQNWKKSSSNQPEFSPFSFLGENKLRNPLDLTSLHVHSNSLELVCYPMISSSHSKQTASRSHSELLNVELMVNGLLSSK